MVVEIIGNIGLHVCSGSTDGTHQNHFGFNALFTLPGYEVRHCRLVGVLADDEHSARMSVLQLSVACFATVVDEKTAADVFKFVNLFVRTCDFVFARQLSELYLYYNIGENFQLLMYRIVLEWEEMYSCSAHVPDAKCFAVYCVDVRNKSIGAVALAILVWNG